MCNLFLNIKLFFVLFECVWSTCVMLMSTSTLHVLKYMHESPDPAVHTHMFKLDKILTL